MFKNEINCEATVDELLELALGEEDKLWDDLAEMGFIDIEVESLPEPAVFLGNSTWQGISGRRYLVNPQWWIEWEAIYEGFKYSEKVNRKELDERYNDPTIRIIKKELL